MEISPAVAEGIYSNLVVITHSPNEFILDFVEHLPGFPQPRVRARILMTPENTKRFLSALMGNMEKYESRFGRVKVRETPNVTPMGFGGEA